ncbi:MAG: hypothetical protein WB973_19275 [Thermoanaerobaculia bacterium]
MYGRELTILADFTVAADQRITFDLTGARASDHLVVELLPDRDVLEGQRRRRRGYALLEMVNLGEGLELELDRRVARLQVLEQPAPGISTSTGTRAFPPGPGRRA